MAGAYRDCQFHQIYQRVHNFCVNDLGGLYLDVLKDRLYTTPVAGHARRSAQTAMFQILQAMVRWLAPILSFTAEEIWQALPGRESAVEVRVPRHLAPVPGAAAIHHRLGCADLRCGHAVQRELEKLREAGTIGAPLEAAVEVYALPELASRLAALGDELRFLTITSAARVHPVHAAPDDAVAAEVGNVVIPGLWISVRRSGGQQVCALLASDRRRGQCRGTSRAVRTLCRQCVGPAGGAPACLSLHVVGDSRALRGGRWVWSRSRSTSSPRN